MLWTQGCTRGRHSNVKPQEPLRPEVSSDKDKIKHTNDQEIIYQGPKSAEKLQKERPRCVWFTLGLRSYHDPSFSNLHGLSGICQFAYTFLLVSFDPPAAVQLSSREVRVKLAAASLEWIMQWITACVSQQACADPSVWSELWFKPCKTNVCVCVCVCLFVCAAQTSPWPSCRTKCRRRWLRCWRNWTSAWESRAKWEVSSQAFLNRAS